MSELPMFLQMDASSRTCRVLAISRNLSFGLRMLFPENYPFSDVPTFEFLDPNLSSDIKHRFHKVNYKWFDSVIRASLMADAL
jgi:hypothetical protein